MALAWEKVKSETISKCFRKASILQHDTMDVAMRAQDDDEDPFIVSDECMELKYLIEKTIPSEQSCSVTLHSEEEIPVCVDIDGDDWDANFLAQLGGDVGDKNLMKMMACKNLMKMMTWVKTSLQM